MHYSSGSRRVDEAAGLAGIDEMISNLSAKIQRRDREVANSSESDPYSWEARKQALAWQHERPVLIDALVQLQQKKQLHGPDRDWRPSPNGFFVGSDS
jgi:hypothetical protein